MSVSEGRRPEEESSFWKISAERSRLEGEQADFQSLTPSQIKSLEKGEKPLPSYLRQVSTEIYQRFSLSGCIFFLVQVTAARHFLFIYFGNKASQFWSVLFLTNNRLKSSSKPNTCHLSYRAVHPQIEFSLKLRKLASVKPPQVSEKQMVNAYFSSTFVVAVIFALYSLINHLHSLPRSYKKPKGNFNNLSLRKCLNNFSKSTFVLFVLIKIKYQWC